MPLSRILASLLSIALLIEITSLAMPAGGTRVIAEKGTPTYGDESWPEGVATLLQHETRGTGWNDWFSQWPNDVNHYEFQVISMDEVNDVIDQFAQIEVAEGRPRPEIHLCPAASPNGFGWLSRFPDDRKLSMIFAIGDQERMDQWYESSIQPRGGNFGVLQFEEAPVAVPPTLTLFVGEPAIDLEKLKIPEGVLVREGGLPGQWHSAKMTVRKSGRSEEKTSAVIEKELSPEETQQQVWRMKIQSYLKGR